MFVWVYHKDMKCKQVAKAGSCYMFYTKKKYIYEELIKQRDLSWGCKIVTSNKICLYSLLGPTFPVSGEKGASTLPA